MAVFITGASSGLGEALAVRYAAAGHTLGLLGRRKDALLALAARVPGEHHIYAIDIRDREALHAAARHFEQAVGTVDLVIASAGVSAGTLTGEPDDFEVFTEIFATNVFATMATFEPFISGMTQRRAGTLVGMSSVAGVRGLPGAGAYSASKSAVTTYCESLRLELKPRGVAVVTIAPGYVRTAMTARNPYRMPFLMDADDFARRAERAIAKHVSYSVIPWQMGVVARVMRCLPDWLYDRLAVDAPRKPRRGEPSRR